MHLDTKRRLALAALAVLGALAAAAGAYLFTTACLEPVLGGGPSGVQGTGLLLGRALLGAAFVGVAVRALSAALPPTVRRERRGPGPITPDFGPPKLFNYGRPRREP